MKKMVLFLTLSFVSSAVLATECTPSKARDAANAFFNKRNEGNTTFVTGAESERVQIGKSQLQGNLKMKFTVLGGGIMAEIGEIELHPETCAVVNLNSSSAISTTFVP